MIRHLCFCATSLLVVHMLPDLRVYTDDVVRIGMLGLENTLIVFTSDNGPTDWPKYYQQPSSIPPGSTGPYFGRKWSLFEGRIRMPLKEVTLGECFKEAGYRTAFLGKWHLVPTEEFWPEH